jgi:CubicO group peptidase (beta-lactamase class C family)
MAKEAYHSRKKIDKRRRGMSERSPFFRLLSTLLPANTSQPKTVDFGELETSVQKALQKTKTPGAAVAIVSGDNVIFAKGFGISNVETGTPVTADMLFRIGSLTKMITATVLVSLAEEGKLSLSTPIGEYVEGLSPTLASVTAHQLLSHTSGLKDDFSHYGPHDESALIDAVRRYPDSYFLAQPGEFFSYSGLGYAVAGVVIEAVGEKPYSQQVVERVLEPLGMKRSTFHPTLAMTYPFSQGHIVSKSEPPTVVRPYDDTSARWPSGFLFSSVNELARFAIAFINGGRIEGKQVLEPAVIARLSTPQSDRIDLDSVKYGYGLSLRNEHGLGIVEHGGGRRGFCSHLLMVPEHRFAIIVLANQLQAWRVLHTAVNKAMKRLLPLQPRSKSKPKTPFPIGQAQLEDYVGTYENAFLNSTATENREIFRKCSRLFCKVGDRELPMTFVGEDRWAIAQPFTRKQEFVFSRDGDRKIAYLHFDSRAWKRSTQQGTQPLVLAETEP